MKSAIITIGDEILIGQVTDTNAVWISQQLNALGVQVEEMVTVSGVSSIIKSTPVACSSDLMLRPSTFINFSTSSCLILRTSPDTTFFFRQSNNDITTS